MNGFPVVIGTRQDMENLMADADTRTQALAMLQIFMDEQYGFDASGMWVLVGGGGLERLGLTRAEAVIMGAEDRVVDEPERVKPPLEYVRDTKLATIRAACGAALDPLAVAYPEREVQSWPQQIAEATALEANPSATAQLVREMAAARPSLGETLEERAAELARRIRANAAAWSVIAGPIIGKRQALEDAVLAAYAAGNQRAIEAIVVDFGNASTGGTSVGQNA